MRANGLVADARFTRHDHVGWCSPDAAGLSDVARRVFGAAEPTERLVFLCDDPARDHLVGLPGRDRMLAEGRLVVADTHDVYRPVTDLDSEFDPLAQLAEFDALVERAFADGFEGLRVVAENTRMLQGDDTAVRRWLAWEQLTDQWQVQRPVTGTCFFDRSQLDPRRLEAVLGLHPKLVGAALPPLRTFADTDALVLSGSLEASDDARLRDVLSLAAARGDVVVELADLDYMHHRPLLVLAEFATAGVRVRLRNASPMIRRLQSVLPDETRRLEWA